ncbi:unnamed protein product, partial [marine sediment metagenome]
ISVAAGAVLVLAAWAMWAMSARQTVAALARAESSSTAFAVLQRIEQEVLRAREIQVPDPEYPAASSIRLDVGTGRPKVYRAFRLADGQLVVDMEDESAEPLRVFEGIDALEFTLGDPPMNSVVEIACTVTIDGQRSVLRSAAKKRN